MAERTPPKTLIDAICGILNSAEQAGNRLSPQQVFHSLGEHHSRDEVQTIERMTRGQSKNQRWLEHHVGMVTASIAHKVYTRVQTIRTKMGPHDVRAVLKLVMRETGEQTVDMQRGLFLKTPAKDAYLLENRQHKSMQIRDLGLCVLQDKPFIGASPDGVVSCACCSGDRLILVKCPTSMENFEQSQVRRGSDPKQLKETSLYFTQVQVQMGITGVAAADVFVYDTEMKTLTLNVPFSKEYFEGVVERAKFFFLSYVLPHIVQDKALPPLGSTPFIGFVPDGDSD